MPLSVSYFIILEITVNEDKCKHWQQLIEKEFGIPPILDMKVQLKEDDPAENDLGWYLGLR